jgi:hypothetical protein
MAEYDRFADFHDLEYDLEERRTTHMQLFGHEPPADPGEQCQHPVHAAIRRAMNDATLEIPFDPSEVVSEDSVAGQLHQDRYDLIYGATRQFQQMVEEEETWEKMRKVGLVHPRTMN